MPVGYIFLSVVGIFNEQGHFKPFPDAGFLTAFQSQPQTHYCKPAVNRPESKFILKGICVRVSTHMTAICRPEHMQLPHAQLRARNYCLPDNVMTMTETLLTVVQVSTPKGQNKQRIWSANSLSTKDTVFVVRCLLLWGMFFADCVL